MKVVTEGKNVSVSIKCLYMEQVMSPVGAERPKCRQSELTAPKTSILGVWNRSVKSCRSVNCINQWNVQRPRSSTGTFQWVRRTWIQNVHLSSSDLFRQIYLKIFLTGIKFQILLGLRRKSQRTRWCVLLKDTTAVNVLSFKVYSRE